jgi:microcystin-dependent protein
MKGFRKCVVVLAVAAVTGAAGTRADVLCERKGSGIVEVHPACHKKELPLDLSQLVTTTTTTTTSTTTTLPLTGLDTNKAAPADGATCTLGQILLTASPIATAGGVPANGQILAITGNEVLFSLLGTTYGGNGTTTFALPDLRALAPNNMTYSICDRGDYPSRRP